MMRHVTIGALAALALAAAGCETPMRLRPGMAGLIVRVRAEPKAGYDPPIAPGSPGDPYAFNVPGAAPVERGQFERIDYDTLDNIVVWAAPLDGAPNETVSPAIAIDVPRVAPLAGGPVFVTGVGGKVALRNRRDAATAVYSVSEGNDFDLGRLAPDGEATWSPRAAGVVDVLCEALADPIATVYVAPTGLVDRVRSGEQARFPDLTPGRYRVVCWHPRLPGSQTQTTLVHDEVSRVSLTVGVNSLPKVP